MQVALITVGDELLAGDTVNTNANWLADRLSDRGVTIRRILSLPDDRSLITDRVRAYSDDFDAVIVTGGIGGTPDDVTMAAVADAFDRTMVVPELTRSAVEKRLEELDAKYPDLELSVDPRAEAAVPAGSRPLVNERGLVPGCVLENVYVLPGIPAELKAMFETVAPEFEGDRSARVLYTVEPEANLVPSLESVLERFDVTVGCYPDPEAGHNRLKLTGTDPECLDEAAGWLLENVDASETPVSRFETEEASGDV